MKYILTAISAFFLCLFSLITAAQNDAGKPFFAKYFEPVVFNYKDAYIKIDDKEAGYDDLLKLQDSSMLRVELYTKKEAIKQFGKDIGKYGVILFTSKKYKAPPSVVTTEDSLSYYTQQGIKAYLKPDSFPTLNGDTTYISWVRFLQKNLRSNTPTERGAPMGVYKINVRFAINEAGAVSEISVDEDAGFGTKAEVMRLMSQCPAWQPGMYKGKPLKCYQQEPIYFAVVEM